MRTGTGPWLVQRFSTWAYHEVVIIVVELCVSGRPVKDGLSAVLRGAFQAIPAYEGTVAAKIGVISPTGGARHSCGAGRQVVRCFAAGVPYRPKPRPRTRVKG